MAASARNGGQASASGDETAATAGEKEGNVAETQAPTRLIEEAAPDEQAAPGPQKEKTPENRTKWERFIRAFEFLLLVSGVVGLLSSLVLWRVGKSEFHLVTWVRTSTLIYPTDFTGGRPLPLSYEGEAARSVTVLDLTISNFGKQVIGSADRTWRLSLGVPSASQVVALDGARARPHQVVVRTTHSDIPNVVVLELGALEPRAGIDLRLLATNSSPADNPDVTARASLAGLPTEVTSSSPQSRLAERLFPPIAGLLLVVLAIAVSREAYRDRDRLRAKGKPVRVALGYMAQILFFAAFLGALLAMALGWLVSWFI